MKPCTKVSHVMLMLKIPKTMFVNILFFLYFKHKYFSLKDINNNWKECFLYTKAGLQTLWSFSVTILPYFKTETHWTYTCLLNLAKCKPHQYALLFGCKLLFRLRPLFLELALHYRVWLFAAQQVVSAWSWNDNH